MRGLVLIAVLESAACTIGNPAYEAIEGAGTSGGETTRGATAEATAETTVVADESSDGQDACELHDPEGLLRMRVRQESGPDMEPDCTEDFRRLPVSSNAFLPNGNIEHVLCDAPACGCMGTTLTIDFEGTLMPPPALTNCGELTLWAHMGPDGCEWGGMMLHEGNTFLPEYIVARTRRLPAFTEQFELADRQWCNDIDECPAAPPGPGRYSLTIFEQSVSVEDSPQTIGVPFLDGGAPVPYSFVNRISSITPQCELQLAWTAQRE
jgi:hypothetical protein